MKLRTKVFCIFITVAVIPLLLITSIAYSRYTQTTNQRMDETAANVFHNAAAELNDTIETIKQTAGLFTFYSDGDFSIIENLKLFSDPNVEHSSYEVLKANQNTKFVCQNVLYSYDYIYGLYVFTPSGVVLSHKGVQNGDLIVGYDPSEDEWYREVLNLRGSLYVSPVKQQEMFSGKKESVFFAESLYDVYSHEFLGVLVIDCNPELFNISNINTMPEIIEFTLKDNKHGEILYTDQENTSSVSTKRNYKTYSETLTLDSLELTAVVDYDALFREFSFTGILLIVSALVCGIGILLTARILSRSLTQPIEHLSRKMAKQDGRHLSTSSQYLNRTDEIGTLYNEYNNMIDELNSSIKRDYQDKLIALDAQMKSLEARINSHFLFNTLESINSIAEIEDNDRIATMSLALGNMFRYSIKTPSELVSIEDELKNVHDYVCIQQIRFDHKFSLDVKIPQDMYALKVLKLILQPLVENSLYHGLNYCTAGDTIEILGRKETNYIYLNVNDNGKGMSPDTLAALNSRLMEEATFTELGHRTKHSIGLKNIQTRIELYYGRGYGLAITSEEGKGTHIQIKIPVLEKKEGHKCIPS